MNCMYNCIIMWEKEQTVVIFFPHNLATEKVLSVAYY